jgi:hypothetical protein
MVGRMREAQHTQTHVDISSSNIDSSYEKFQVIDTSPNRFLQFGLNIVGMGHPFVS